MKRLAALIICAAALALGAPPAGAQAKWWSTWVEGAAGVYHISVGRYEAETYGAIGTYHVVVDQYTYAGRPMSGGHFNAWVDDQHLDHWVVDHGDGVLARAGKLRLCRRSDGQVMTTLLGSNQWRMGGAWGYYDHGLVEFRGGAHGHQSGRCFELVMA